MLTSILSRETQSGDEERMTTLPLSQSTTLPRYHCTRLRDSRDTFFGSKFRDTPRTAPGGVVPIIHPATVRIVDRSPAWRQLGRMEFHLDRLKEALDGHHFFYFWSVPLTHMGVLVVVVSTAGCGVDDFQPVGRHGAGARADGFAHAGSGSDGGSVVVSVGGR